MPHHLLVPSVTVLAAVLTANHRLSLLVEQAVPDRPASLKHHPTVTQ
jgi:hypothetical protein